MSEPELRPLTDAALRRVYRERVRADFPPAERRPLSSILRLRAGGCYDTWGMYGEEGLLAYAFLWRGEGCALLDYLAVDRRMRGRGLGSAALELVAARCAGVPLLAEVEAPEEGAPPAENALRLRRQDFYRRAGFAPLGYQAGLYGVRYDMLSRPAVGAEEGRRLLAAHRALYRGDTPALIFRRMIHIPAEESAPDGKDGFL